VRELECLGDVAGTQNLVEVVLVDRRPRGFQRLVHDVPRVDASAVAANDGTDVIGHERAQRGRRAILVASFRCQSIETGDEDTATETHVD
jgi:hypothetical protein